MRETKYLKENKNALVMLKKIERFKAFSEEDLQAFLEVGKLREYDAGETIIRKGDHDHWVYFLISGEVKIVKEEKIFATLKRGGDLFGEMGVIDQSPRSASVWALTKTMVLGLDCSNISARQGLKGVIFHYTIFRLFAENLAERLRVTSDDVIYLQKALKEKEEELASLKAEMKKEGTLWV